jgi:hypothetical protein
MEEEGIQFESESLSSIQSMDLSSSVLLSRILQLLQLLQTMQVDLCQEESPRHCSQPAS